MRRRVREADCRSRAVALLCCVAALASGLAALGIAGGSAASAAPPGAGLPVARGGLDVLPFPGTPDAAPRTPIDFPALTPAQIRSVRAVGSRTGAHSGTLSAQPGRAGTQFAPARAFAPGERVSVIATLASPAAGAASGAAGSRVLRFSFKVARPGATTSTPAGGAATAAQDSGMLPPRANSSATQPVTHSFVSAPGLRPPIVDMVGQDTDTTAGDIFLDAQNSGQNGPYFLNGDGDLLWDHPTSGTGVGQAAFDQRVQTYNGQPVLTYWEGRLIPPAYTGNGVGVMLNEKYQKIHRVTAGAGYQGDGIDEHEFAVTPQGDALVTVYAPVKANLSSVGGPTTGTVLDSIVQEINIATNRVVWEWSSLAHVPISDSYAKYKSGTPFDYFHVNSIQQLPGGSLIVSGRNVWAAFSISRKNGKVNWEVGGKHPSFKMGPGTNFEWQHDVELHANNVLSVFDDAFAGGPGTQKESQSRALKLQLKPGSASLIHAYLHSPPVLAGSQGNVQMLFNGNVFVGWGAAPTFSEYTASGTQIFKAWFRSPVQSYRAYRFDNWTGLPQSPPALVAKSSSTSGQDNLYTSWNGATQVAQWRVLGGPTSSALTPVTTVPWSSFETTIPVSTASDHYFEVEALDSNGNVLAHGTSAVVKAP